MSGNCDGKAVPTIIKETPATAFVSGKNAIGMVHDNSNYYYPHTACATA